MAAITTGVALHTITQLRVILPRVTLRPLITAKERTLPAIISLTVVAEGNGLVDITGKHINITHEYTPGYNIIRAFSFYQIPHGTGLICVTIS